MSYQISALQTKSRKPTFQDIEKCNKVAEFTRATYDFGIWYRSKLQWENAVLVSMTDASHANEEEWIDELEILEPFRSQSGRLSLLCDASILDGNAMTFHVLSFGSNKIAKVCRSTISCETYSMQMGEETTAILRASFADLHGKLEPKCWEDSAASFVPMLWLTDCFSAVTCLQRTVMAKVADKRLGIELASLRQSLWRSREGGRHDPRVADTRPHDATDVVRWIDTKVMLCDCMTKDMDGAMLMRAIKKN